MEGKRISSFAEFWPYYLSQHQNPWCRALHYLGSTLAPALIIYAGLSAEPRWLVLLPLLGYGPSWIGHYVIEKNRPASFQYPFYSLLADYLMLFRFITGRLNPPRPP